MNTVYLNLTIAQLAELGQAAANGKPLTIILSKTQFVNESSSSQNTVEIKLTKAQVTKLKQKNLTISLSALQVKKTVEGINKIHGGALPLLALAPLLMKGIAALGAIGAAAGGASQIANAVNNKKHQTKMEDETKRHNTMMEQKLVRNGNGIFLGPPRKGEGLYLKPHP